MRAALEFLKPYAAARAKLTADSGAVDPGDVFVALPGARAHGLDFIAEAERRGAAAVLHDGARPAAGSLPSCAVEGLPGLLGGLASEYYGRPSARLRLVAITGTKGKTTAAVWCAQLLAAAGAPCGYAGTLGAGPCGAGIDAIRRTSRLTTPDVLHLHGLLAGFVSAGCAAAAIEASSHGLAQDRLAGVECDVAVFTNIGQDHLDYHAGWDDYLRAKLLLFARPELQAAVVNADDAHAARASASAACPTFACGESSGCDLAWRLAGRRAEFTHAGRSMGCDLPLPGRHNASNLALAIGAALQAGAAWDEVERRLALLRPLPGRLERIDAAGAGGGRAACYVDFAHTPEALRAALQALRAEHPAGKLLCVFGCGGDRDRGKRPLMGAAACAAADRVFVTTDNPRDEEPAAIAQEALAGCDAKAETILDRRAAIAAAVAAAGAADAVLVAGKGDEDEIVGPRGQRTPFSDRAVLRAVLAGAADG